MTQSSSVQDRGGRQLDPGEEEEGLEARASVAGHRGRARSEEDARADGTDPIDSGAR